MNAFASCPGLPAVSAAEIDGLVSDLGIAVALPTNGAVDAHPLAGNAERLLDTVAAAVLGSVPVNPALLERVLGVDNNSLAYALAVRLANADTVNALVNVVNEASTLLSSEGRPTASETVAIVGDAAKGLFLLAKLCDNEPNPFFSTRVMENLFMAAYVLSSRTGAGLRASPETEALDAVLAAMRAVAPHAVMEDAHAIGRVVDDMVLMLSQPLHLVGMVAATLDSLLRCLGEAGDGKDDRLRRRAVGDAALTCAESLLAVGFQAVDRRPSLAPPSRPRRVGWIAKVCACYHQSCLLAARCEPESNDKFCETQRCLLQLMAATVDCPPPAADDRHVGGSVADRVLAFAEKALAVPSCDARVLSAVLRVGANVAAWDQALQFTVAASTLYAAAVGVICESTESVAVGAAADLLSDVATATPDARRDVDLPFRLLAAMEGLAADAASLNPWDLRDAFMAAIKCAKAAVRIAKAWFSPEEAYRLAVSLRAAERIADVAVTFARRHVTLEGRPFLDDAMGMLADAMDLDAVLLTWGAVLAASANDDDIVNSARLSCAGVASLFVGAVVAASPRPLRSANPLLARAVFGLLYAAEASYDVVAPLLVPYWLADRDGDGDKDNGWIADVADWAAATATANGKTLPPYEEEDRAAAVVLGVWDGLCRLGLRPCVAYDTTLDSRFFDDLKADDVSPWVINPSIAEWATRVVAVRLEHDLVSLPVVDLPDDAAVLAICTEGLCATLNDNCASRVAEAALAEYHRLAMSAGGTVFARQRLLRAAVLAYSELATATVESSIALLGGGIFRDAVATPAGFVVDLPATFSGRPQVRATAVPDDEVLRDGGEDFVRFKLAEMVAVVADDDVAGAWFFHVARMSLAEALVVDLPRCLQGQSCAWRPQRKGGGSTAVWQPTGDFYSGGGGGGEFRALYLYMENELDFALAHKAHLETVSRRDGQRDCDSHFAVVAFYVEHAALKRLRAWRLNYEGGIRGIPPLTSLEGCSDAVAGSSNRDGGTFVGGSGSVPVGLGSGNDAGDAGWSGSGSGGSVAGDGGSAVQPVWVTTEEVADAAEVALPAGRVGNTAVYDWVLSVAACRDSPLSAVNDSPLRDFDEVDENGLGHAKVPFKRMCVDGVIGCRAVCVGPEAKNHETAIDVRVDGQGRVIHQVAVAGHDVRNNSPEGDETWMEVLASSPVAVFLLPRGSAGGGDQHRRRRERRR